MTEKEEALAILASMQVTLKPRGPNPWGHTPEESLACAAAIIKIRKARRE